MAVAGLFNHAEKPVLQAGLHPGIGEVGPHELLGTKDSAVHIFGSLVLLSISDKTLSVCESHIGSGSVVTHVVGNDLCTVVLPFPNDVPLFFHMFETAHLPIIGRKKTTTPLE